MKFSLEQVLIADAQATVVTVAGGGSGGARPGTPAHPDVAQPPAAPAGGASAGGGGASSGSPRLVGRVVDEVEQPVAGATVLFATGGSAVTDGDGRYAIAGAPGGACFVSSPGFITSVVAAGGLPDTLHLRRTAPGLAAFDSQDVVIRGSVTWPQPAHQGGAVYYRDDHGSLSDPAVVDEDGLFALRVRTQRGGAPRGVVLALAAAADNTPMVGLSQSFALFDQGATPVEVPIVLAAQAVDYAVGAPPASLPELRSSLEITPPGMSPFQLDNEGLTAGQFKVPAQGALPATLRIAVEATNARLERSVVAMDPYAMPATPPAFLALPTVTVDKPAKTIAWSGVDGDGAVMLQLRQAPRLAETYWEGWLEGKSRFAFDAASWPTGASATALVAAMDGQDAKARQVASVRALRLLPAEQFHHAYRLAESQLTFTP